MVFLVPIALCGLTSGTKRVIAHEHIGFLAHERDSPIPNYCALLVIRKRTLGTIWVPNETYHAASP